MYKRPKPNDSEEDVLEMQKQFLTEKTKNKQFQPAAQAILMKEGKKQSLFAKNRSNKEEKTGTSSSTSTSHIILGDIVEKRFSENDVATKSSEPMEIDSENQHPVAFPEIEELDLNAKTIPGKSLFAASMEKKRKAESANLEPSEGSSKNVHFNFGEKSIIVDDTNTAKSIHEENVGILAGFSPAEILAEKQKLLESMDPALVKFLNERKKQKAVPVPDAAVTSKKAKELPESSKIDEDIKDTPVVEILHEKDAENWVHFDVIEKDKLEWMKDVPLKLKKLKPGETFEARFDWKGVLLPYTETETEVDNRELYLHGDDPNRPGYTLQELFRLARSSIIQQRISAFSSIAGLLNIYNQGFYDKVLELPISKIFFLLRFGFDENSPAILEVVSKGLAMMFYNDTDEVVLDLLYEAGEGYLQPIMEVESNDHKSQGIENHLSKLKLTASPFTMTVDENEEETRTSMNDFQLAETDLIECLLRTNIIQRISYILGTVRPHNSTVHSCLKILIRIARANKDACIQIMSNSDLIESIFEYFLPKIEQTDTIENTEFYFYPQYLALKLLRIMLSQHLSICLKLKSMDLIDKLKNYLFSRKDVKANLIKVQIEAFRTIRAVLLITRDHALFKEILPAFRYLLEWHYQHVDFKAGGSFLIRQHAAALLTVIALDSSPDTKATLGEMLAMCSGKWFYEATNHGIDEFSQSLLLSSCLNVVSRLLYESDNQFKDFMEKYLPQFLTSHGFQKFKQNLSRSSILLNNLEDRSEIHPPLPNLGSILDNDGSPQLIIPQMYPCYLLQSIFKLMGRLMDFGDLETFIKYFTLLATDDLFAFVKSLSSELNRKLAKNYFAKTELKLVFKVLSFKGLKDFMPKHDILQATFQLLSCMTPENIQEVEVLLESVVFNQSNLNFDQVTLSAWRQVYLDTYVYPHSIVIPATDLSLSVPWRQTPILPCDWPYLLLKVLLDRHLKQTAVTQYRENLDFTEKEIISISLTFSGLLEQNGLQVVSFTEKFMYIMISFMGPESEFLEPDIKELLQQHINNFYKQCKDRKFQFEGTFEGKSKFENLYILFLEHFQAASYGDPMFSSLVLVPLAQKYDSKWRKMVWSEHASVLRFINCTEEQLLGSIDEYLYPIEDDLSLIRCYSRAVSTNLLRPNSIPHKIASHHIGNYKPKPVSEKM